MQLTGKTALITGAGRGLGRAIALGLAQQGAAVVVAARSSDEVAETVWLIEDSGQQALGVETDVRDLAQVERLLQETVQAFGGPHILVTSAGVGLRRPLQETDEAAWDTVFDTLLKGTFLTARATIPHMIAAGGGNILFLGAPLDKIAVPGFGAYYSAKCGVEGLAKVMAKELRRHGINVNVIHPGGFADTRMVRETVPEVTKGLLNPADMVAAAVELATLAPRARSGEVVDAHSWKSVQN
jgi:3-oxoacyl-[acyl-carrier protein] reductase